MTGEPLVAAPSPYVVLISSTRTPVIYGLLLAIFSAASRSSASMMLGKQTWARLWMR